MNTPTRKPADVFFCNTRTTPFGDSLPDKLVALARAAGMDAIDFKDKFVAIKIHFGERGNLSFIRPNFVRALALEIKRLGGRPFLTDCNTLYVGYRRDALSHLETAALNGFNPTTTACEILIGDGLKGTDEAVVPVPGGRDVKEARIGRAVMDADIVISLNHFKGHEALGFGGALKNIGMGCASRAGKMDQHSDSKPVVDPAKCIACRLCASVCAHAAHDFSTGKARIDPAKCVGCGLCVSRCPRDAIEPDWSNESTGAIDRKMVEYALATLHGRPHFHLSLAIDISPNCDCHPENDAPIVPDVGFFASFDPVAIDQACADAVNRQPRIPSALLASRPADPDHFHAANPATDWSLALAHAEELGLGTRQYTLHAV